MMRVYVKLWGLMLVVKGIRMAVSVAERQSDSVHGVSVSMDWDVHIVLSVSV